MQIKPTFIWTFTEDILCWFDLYNENWCLWYIASDMTEHEKKMNYRWSLCCGSIHPSLFSFFFWVVVSNDRNAHGLLSSFPLSVLASLTRSLYLIPAPMLMVRLAFPFVCLLAQTNVLISSDLGVGICKLLFIKCIDSTAAGFKNTCSNREIKSMFLMKRFCMSSSLMSVRVNTVGGLNWGGVNILLY